MGSHESGLSNELASEEDLRTTAAAPLETRSDKIHAVDSVLMGEEALAGKVKLTNGNLI